MKYIENVEQNGVWAGYLGINAAGNFFNVNIRLYIISNNIYKLYNEFTQENNEINILDYINLLFINNNHFNMLLRNDYVNVFYVLENIKKLDLMNLKN